MGQKSETDSGFKYLNSSSKNKNSLMSTFTLDNTLPSLPLPDLEKTLNKYLESVRPFVTDLEFSKTQKIVENFRNGIGKHLHFHLMQKAQKERNWVELVFLFVLVNF